MFFSSIPSQRAVDALASTRLAAFWLDRPERPASMPELVGSQHADLLASFHH